MFRKFNIRNKLNIIVGQDRVSFDQETNTLLVPVNFVSSLDFLHFIQTYPYSHLRILSASLITKEVLEAIRDNANIYFVKLGSVDDPYSLSREDFDILNANEHLYSIDTGDVLGEYKSDEMEYLSFFQKSVVGKYSVQNLMFDSFFSFFEKIDDKQISYLKRYIHPQAQIEFHYDQYDNIIQVIQELKEKQLHYHLVKFDDFFSI